MFEQEEIIPLEEDVFRLLRDLIRDYCGIYFDDDTRYLLEKRLSRRAKNHHFSNFRDYFRYLLYDKNRDEELTAIIDILTVNETYFFREMPQLKAFSEEILPEIIDIKKKEGSKDIKIWSAGCSTGEEAYTIAMLFLESKMFNNVNIEVFATDISHRVLHSARRGFYQKHSFRTTDSEMIAKYFIQEENGYKISDKVKEKVNFGYFNLLDSDKSAFINRMDLIFCRNVIIYFDMPAKRKVIEMFYEKLSNLGFLLLGHSESLINISTAFTLRHFKNDMVYQKIAK